MTDQPNNAIPVDILLPWMRRYAHLDSKDYRGDKLFVDHEIPVTFEKGEWSFEGSDFTVIFCHFHKRYEHEFLSCMKELDRKLALLHPDDYAAAMSKFAPIVEKFRETA